MKYAERRTQKFVTVKGQLRNRSGERKNSGVPEEKLGA
jgi:hypothetical protein